jgi:YidC/Oxa1 family membrane protein insertase
MSEIFGAIERGLGSALNAVYEATGSYLLAIVLLTVVVRALLIPLTVKQTRSMKKMQELAPQTKAIQRKYKDLQQKAKDRMELQQIRMEMNREMQGVYREAGVNPLGGCLPLLAQMPVFIAMFSIMRAAISIFPQSATLIGGADVDSIGEAFADKDLKGTICRPFDAESEALLTPTANGTPNTFQCVFPSGDPVVVELDQYEDKQGDEVAEASWISQCQPIEVVEESVSFSCRSALGTGHVPQDGELFRDLSTDDATVVGLLPGCSANEITSDAGLRRCTSTKGPGEEPSAIPYYLLVGLIAATSYYSTKQLQSRQTTGMADQQRMVTRIMPVLFGFISLSIPSGANTYFLATNVWTIGQQYVMFRGQKPATPETGKKAVESRPVKQKPSQQGNKSPNRNAPKGKSGRSRKRR